MNNIDEMKDEIYRQLSYIDSEYAYLQFKNKNLQQRIDKAIEYVDKLGTQEGMIKDYKIDMFIKDDILSILKGENNE